MDSFSRSPIPDPRSQSWASLGGGNIWLPYTQMKTASEPLMAVATRGSRIHLADGRELIDGVASWWTACHGYNHPHIVAEMKEQLERMPHIMFGGINHEPALRLAKRLASLAPGDLERVFFTDSGSVAVEVALKMAVQYWLNKGDARRAKFLSFRHGYHGDTAACMAICDPEEGMHKHFEQYLAKQFIADLPADEAATKKFNDLLAQNKQTIAAVIIEPLVQGAGGMRMHDAATLRRVAELCAKHDVLLIADEIFTGFGRTGTMFACEQARIVPDIMCLGKGLTGGAMTLAATLARRHIFEAFWSDDPRKALMHGPTYMANPLASAAANASLDLFEREPRLAEVKQVEAALRTGLESCRALPRVVGVRVLGAIGAVQVSGALDHEKIRAHLIEQGVWVRSWNDCIYLTPALNIAAADLAALTQAVHKTAAAL
jgi:adenosylmethionine---8-amino-7-oxononanoate aminotransferase